MRTFFASSRMVRPDRMAGGGAAVVVSSWTTAGGNAVTVRRDVLERVRALRRLAVYIRPRSPDGHEHEE